MSLEDDVKDALPLRVKLAAWVFWSWFKENGMDLIGKLLGNVFTAKGWQTTLVGVPLLMLAAFVTWYCATDATGGWIDPHCATYVKVALWASGIGHILAPGYTATIGKK